MKRLASIAVLLWALFQTMLGYAFQTSTTVGIRKNPSDIRVHVAVARTPDQRERGLMGVTDLAGDQGMLFVYPRASRNRFWMKNTPTSLDILFLDANRRIVFMAKSAVPYSEEVIDPGVDSQFVLEVRAGFADKHHLAIGDFLFWENVESALN